MSVVVAIISTVLGSVACVPEGTERTDTACTSQTFDLNNHAEPLGSSKALIQAFDDAADRKLDVTTMAETAGRANWSFGWDRVFYLGPAMTDEYLKSVSAADLRLVCFLGLPQRSSNSDLRAPHATVFMADGKPVQAVWWKAQDPSLSLGPHGFVQPDTPIRYDPESGTMRAD
ncbi:hypothetical protein OG225_25460 [Nocardia sp. NBC_01377]|uniref:hypothetical protein n=1 Tax=Nocardia sp. NBC_01377 TaxID=2903595 RepID=UPI003248F99C